MKISEWEKLYAELKKIEPKIDQIKITLEEYLRALLGLAYENMDNSPSLDIFLKMLKKAFIADPLPFEESWLKIQDPPIEDYDLDLSHLQDGVELIKHETKSPEDDFRYLEEVLHFQIAELKRMEIKQPQSQGKYFGIESESGHHWYNFEPFANIEAGIRGYIENLRNGAYPVGAVTWRTLGEIIELGRIYE
ncbi:MAG: hypothetical protein NW226_06225 [Microscillaceae bacterium]|nr:hypothetical protein [Microscillaceae bacterium]